MLSSLLRAALENRFWIYLISATLAIYGVYNIKNISLDAVPDITNPLVVVNTQTRSLDPEQVEKTVTYFIETEMAGIPGLKDVRSISKFGLSNVTLTFKEGTNIYWARQVVSERIQNVLDKLPVGMSPQMTPISTGLGEVYFYSLEAEEGSELSKKPDAERLLFLRTTQDYIIRPQIKAGVRNIADVDSIGGYSREIHIDFNPIKLEKEGLSVNHIVNTLRSAGENFGGGYIERNNQTLLVRTDGQIPSLKKLEEFPLRLNPFGRMVRVKDVASVMDHGKQRVGSASYNGHEAVLGMVLLLAGSNARNLLDDLEVLLPKLYLPQGVKVIPLFDRRFLVDSAIHTVSKNLAEGAVLVILILFVFLRKLKPSFAVASIIPFSMILTFLGMEVFHISANLMSLGAIDFGLLVDSAVVFTETVVHRLELGENKDSNSTDFILSALNPLLKPVTTGIAIIMLVYAPILTLEGVEGKMFRPMAITVIIALASSYLLSVFLLPVILSLIADGYRGKNVEAKPSAALAKYYEPILLYFLHHGKVTLGMTLVLVTVSYLLFRTMGSDFLPRLMEGDIMITMMRKDTISLTETTRLQMETEKTLATFPEVERVFSRTGTSEVANDPMGVNMSDTFVILKKDNILDTIRKDKFPLLLKRMKDTIEKQEEKVEAVVGQPIETRFNELLEGSRADITLRIFGEDFNKLWDFQNRTLELMQTVPGSREVSLDSLSALRRSLILEAKPDYDAMERSGVPYSDYNTTFTAAMSGINVGSFYEKEYRFPIVVRLSEEFRENDKEISKIGVSTIDGGTVPLGYAYKLDVKEKVTTIARNRGRRFAAISINLGDRDIESFVKEAKETFDKEIKLPHGYSDYWGGNFRNLQEAKKRLTWLVPVVLVLIYFLLLQAFRDWKISALVMTSVPFAASGGVLALYARGINFSVSAGIGFIALSGIAILNGLVKINTIQELRNNGVGLVDAVRLGTISRLKPVLMTAGVAALGFVPMAFGNGLGAEVQKPLATVIIGGLFTSTLLTLVVLPVGYYYLENRKLKKEERKDIPEETTPPEEITSIEPEQIDN
jgi:cobalt-zinc-cadmium resistance protein CzcA